MSKLKDYLPRENDVVLVELKITKVDESGQFFFADGGREELAPITTDKVIRLVSRSELTDKEMIDHLLKTLKMIGQYQWDTGGEARQHARFGLAEIGVILP
jgi:hypothetical protein